ncbi:MAG TPA: glycoside hydrolase family 38 C-terminal domain-containing protein [Bauldia sp.]|nr:glycoside hydrolase family 38 C-terminal domain-containing protein [Bauldia sp.]
MSLTLDQRRGRLARRTEELLFWRDREAAPVGDWTLDGAPIAMGGKWPERKGVHRFAASAEVPAHWPIGDARLSLNLGGESLLSLTYDNGDVIRFGLDPYHEEFPLRARRFKIESDSVARLPFGEPVRDPHLNRAYLLWLETAVDDFHLLLTQIIEAVEALAGHEVVPHLLTVAEEALRSLDWPSGTADYVARTAPSPVQQLIWELPETKPNPAALTDAQRDSVVRAHKALVGELRVLQKRFPPQGEVALTGHAHIDLAWLWPYDETRRKMRRTFHTALSLIEQSRDFRFNQSTAHYYAEMEKDDPALFKAIVAKAKAGNWETVGGLWVEPDSNMPTGESLVRQVLYGQRYFERVFGQRHTICWLPDCFGFSGALPQILNQGGINSFFTIKVNWSETNRFPYDLFWWEGLDGSRVLAHTFDNPMSGYNGFVHPGSILPTWRNFRGKIHHNTTLLAVGYGDGGGGPQPEMVRREVQLRDFPALPKARWATIASFFEGAHKAAVEKKLPVWQGEIYLELHRATYTTQSAVKRLHRKAERALITAETAASLAHLIGCPKPQSLEADWRIVLKNEFHDILPGSSIHEVYDDAARELTAVIDAGAKAQSTALAAIASRLPKGAIADALVVVNPSLSSRPIQSSAETVPPLGIRVVDGKALAPVPGLGASKTHLENATLRVAIAADGSVASILHKPTGREALTGEGSALVVYPVDKPRAWDAWDIDGDYFERAIRFTKPESIAVVEDGPHRAAVRITHRYRDSTIIQTLSLAANGKRLDVHTDVDWHERRTMLRVETDIAVRTREVTYECAFGVVKRPTHQNTSWDQAMFEVPGHRFADMSETGFGLALLNDAKYGHSARGNRLGLSLVRSPVYPDPLADEGPQSFTYALMPHAGDWHEGGVREEAEALNQPLLATSASGLAATTLQPLTITGLPVALSTLKPSEEGDGVIARVYEPAGARGKVGVAASGWTVSGPLTVMEEPAKGAADALGPFEIRSWLLARK